MIPIWRGSIIQGELRVENNSEFLCYLSTLEEKNVEVIVRIPKSIRSYNQNRYYWGVVVNLLSEETGYSKDDMHEVLRGMFLSSIINFKGKEIPMVKSTAELNTKEFEDYLSQIRMWASKDLSVYVPDPNEVNF